MTRQLLKNITATYLKCAVPIFPLKAGHPGNQSSSVLMFLLCAAFFTLTEAICDPAGAMLAQTLHPRGTIVALETSTGNHLGWLSDTLPAFTVPVYFHVVRAIALWIKSSV